MRHLSEVVMKHPVRVIQVNETGGAFYIRQNASSDMMKVIASDGEGWDHVSVSCRFRTPTWDEMEWIKRMFFYDHETCMQLHVPPSDHISYAKYALHLWRPQNVDIPRPPDWMVGPREGGDNK